MNKKIKDLLTAHSMAELTDFINPDYLEDYKEELSMCDEEVFRICKEYEGHGISRLTDIIISDLKNNN